MGDWPKTTLSETVLVPMPRMLIIAPSALSLLNCTPGLSLNRSSASTVPSCSIFAPEIAVTVPATSLCSCLRLPAVTSTRWMSSGAASLEAAAPEAAGAAAGAASVCAEAGRLNAALAASTDQFRTVRWFLRDCVLLLAMKLSMMTRKCGFRRDGLQTVPHRLAPWYERRHQTEISRGG